MSNAHFESAFSIPVDHPALAGHFPGRPVVPGVVLLDRVAAAVAGWKHARIAGLPQVKFLRPLLPEEEALLRLEEADGGLRFHISHAGMSIATGRLEIAAEAGA